MTEATILCIDDDVAALVGLVQRFEAAGYNVLRTNDYDHGLLSYEDSSPDLVTLEVGLQRGRGWDLLDHLVASGGRVIVISSHGLVEDVVRGLEAGAVDYITKPYRTDEVLARARLRLHQNLPLPVAAGQGSLQQPEPDESEDLMLPVEPLAQDDPGAEALPSAAAAPEETPPDAAQAEEPALEEAPLGAARAEEPALEEAPLVAALPVAVLAEEAQLEEAPPRTLGARLRAARRVRNISLVQAELETRIRMYYIQALEEERYALLPRGSATERIIRDYAKFLGLDPQEAVGEYRILYHNSDEPQHDLGPLGEFERSRRGTRILLWVFAALLALALTIGALFYFVPNDMATLWQNIQDWLLS